MKVWEYLASGRSIIYSDLAIMREILDGRATAFTPESAASLAEKVVAVYQDTAYAERIAAGNPGAVREFTWEKRAMNILDFIQEPHV